MNTTKLQQAINLLLEVLDDLTSTITIKGKNVVAEFIIEDNQRVVQIGPSFYIFTIWKDKSGEEFEKFVKLPIRHLKTGEPYGSWEVPFHEKLMQKGFDEISADQIIDWMKG